MAPTADKESENAMPFTSARFSPVSKAGRSDSDTPQLSGPASSGGKGAAGSSSGGPRRHHLWLRLCGDCPAFSQPLQHAVEDRDLGLAKRVAVLALHLLDTTGRNFGQVCFANNPLSGLLIVIGLATADPIVAASGLAASIVGTLFALLLQQPYGNISAGLSCYNAALLGSVMPALLLGPGSGSSVAGVWLTVLIGAAITVVMTSAVANGLGSFKPALPCMTLPFNLVALFSIICLRVHTPPASEVKVIAAEVNDLDWAMLLQGAFYGAGQVFAVQGLWASGLVLLGMALCSPLLATAGFLGSFIGTFLGAAVSSSLYEAAYGGLLGYNAFLAACCVCYFFVPTLRSLLLGVVSSTLTLAVQVALGWAFSDVHLPVLTLPFVGASLLLLGVTSEGLPRPSNLSFPEQHRAAWQRDRRRDSLESNASETHEP